jgi:hypothetical protein
VQAALDDPDAVVSRKAQNTEQHRRARVQAALDDPDAVVSRKAQNTEQHRRVRAAKRPLSAYHDYQINPIAALERLSESCGCIDAMDSSFKFLPVTDETLTTCAQSYQSVINHDVSIGTCSSCGIVVLDDMKHLPIESLGCLQLADERMRIYNGLPTQYRKHMTVMVHNKRYYNLNDENISDVKSVPLCNDCFNHCCADELPTNNVGNG